MSKETMESPLSILKGNVCKVPEVPLHRLFENIAKSTARNNTALLFYETTCTRNYTYSEVDDLSNRIARCICEDILRNKLSPNRDGDYVIAVSLKPSAHLVIILLAIWKAGAAYLPLDVEFPRQRVHKILQEALPALVIYDEDKGNFLDSHKLLLEDLLTKQKTYNSETLCTSELLPSKENPIGVILYTSGSTGIPKGVRLSHRTILNRLQWQFDTFPYGEFEKTAVFKTALTFVDSVSEIWGPLLNGLSLLVLSKETILDPEKLVGVLEKHKIERFILVPSLLKSLLTYFYINENKHMLPYLTTWICSGETLTTSLTEEFYEYFTSSQYRLCNFYGSTEIMGDVVYHIVSKEDQVNYHGKIPIGVPINNTNIYLLDNNLNPVKPGEVGELYVSGLNVAAGYVNGQNSGKFIKNPQSECLEHAVLFKTGDFSKLEKQVLLYEGRTDSQVKIRGNRVDLCEIEKEINSMKEVNKAVVLCYKPGEINQKILAFITSDVILQEISIKNLLKKVLVSYMVPEIVLIKEVPLLVNGKVDQQLLLQQYEKRNSIINGHLNCSLNMQLNGISKCQVQSAKVLFETVLSVINISNKKILSVSDNFYEIGGNSLNSFTTIAALKDRGYYISIEDFITAKNFGQVLDKLSLERRNDNVSTDVYAGYTTEPLQDCYKNEITEMFSETFFNKSTVEKWIITQLSQQDYRDLFEILWEPLLQAGLSFVLKSRSGKLIGFAANFDIADEPSLEIHSNLSIMLEFLDSVEDSFRNRLPKGKGKVLHSFILAANPTLSSHESILAVKKLEGELIRLGKDRKFEGILTTNTNPLTQQLASYVFSYATLLEYSINKYVAPDNTKPFGMAPDSDIVLVQWKNLM